MERLKLKEIKLFFSFFPTLIFSCIAIGFLIGMCKVGAVIVFSMIINGIKYSLNNNSGFARFPKYLFILYIVLLIVIWLLPSVQKYVENIFKAKIYTKNQWNLAEKKYNISYTETENEKILNQFSLMKDLDETVLQTIQALVFLIVLFIQLIGIFFLIYQYSAMSALILLILLIPIAFISYKSSQQSFESSKEVQKSVRQYNIFAEILEDTSYASERILFKYQEYFISHWKKLFEEARIYQKKFFSKLFFKAQIGGVLFTFFGAVSIYFLYRSYEQHHLTFGLFSALVIAFVELSEVLSWNFSDNIDKLVKGLNSITEFNSLSMLTEEKRLYNKAPFTGFKKLTVDHLSFRYATSSNLILDDISFTMEVGKVYALVGENGCGKSTLVKILAGLYAPSAGIIYLNEDVVEDNYEIKMPISVVLQDFAHYYLTIKQVVLLGNDQDISDQKIIQVLEDLNLNIDIEALPDKLNTILGKIYGEGLDLSGGQWQKLSLARAVLSDSPIIILDEPTAALDPISEIQVIKKFEELCKDRAILYISHRLGATKNVDEIMVLKNGKLLERGTHEALMTKKSIYKKMFLEQKRWYA